MSDTKLAETLEIGELKKQNDHCAFIYNYKLEKYKARVAQKFPFVPLFGQDNTFRRQ